ncbi:MAG: hypothetical protein AAFP86_04450 [Planctomycetota bacterium]
MANFKTPKNGGNVVHRIELPVRSRRRRSGARGDRPAPETRVIIQRVPAEPQARPEAAPRPEPAARSAPPAVPARAAARPGPLKDSQARRQIEVLERRLAKMARLLEDRDQLLAGRQAPAEDEGVASIYREVQGIQGRTAEVKQKKALMSKIFEANLDLRKRIISGSPGPA